ncbi:MAG: VCBS repeat-containing protein [Planctomyces sp.]|nr:VCBS repeat-containing protein [Planctomyces sp.]
MRRLPVLLVLAVPALLTAASAEDRVLHTFRRIQLTDVYYSEGANAGDLNNDGHPDVVYGPFWYAGPDFQTAHEIYPPKPQPLDFYADNFFNWVYDFNGDGWADVFVVGFPGTPAYVYENPGDAGGHWPRHQVFDSVANESPHFIDVLGDGRPELVCTFQGKYGFATFHPERPFQAWTFHVVSDQSAPERFGHGLGVGDVNGDGRSDILMATGWFEQPAENALNAPWPFHETKFTPKYGGAEMHAYDVDGDGLNDVITSLAAHDFGLAWYQQSREGDERTFDLRMIMNERPEENRHGLVFTELHSVALADIDGDGLQDIVTGKTYWSHHRQSPMWDAGAVVYWFRLERTDEGVVWTPYLADGEAGIGRQISIADLNGDGLPDIVVGGMKGCHVLLHETRQVDEATWRAAQPKLREAD